MGFSERQKLYEELESIRQRPLLVYVTCARPGGIQGMISVDVIPEFQDQLDQLPASSKSLDLLVVSNGGDPTVAWRLMSLMRERVESVAVLVPQAAFSAATLLALGADEIVMHPNGNLGPVDPQIVAPKPGGGVSRFAFEDLDGVLAYAKEELGLEEQQHRLHVFDRICQEVGALTVGFAARRSLLSISMGEKLLRLHMKDERGQQAKKIAEALNKQFYDHGYPLGRREAAEFLGTVKTPPPKVEELMGKVWRDVEAELKMRVPFDLMSELMTNPHASHLLDPGAYDPKARHTSYDFEVVLSLLESTRHRSRHAIQGKILVTRTGELKWELDQVVTRRGWMQG